MLKARRLAALQKEENFFRKIDIQRKSEPKIFKKIEIIRRFHEGKAILDFAQTTKEKREKNFVKTRSKSWTISDRPEKYFFKSDFLTYAASSKIFDMKFMKMLFLRNEISKLMTWQI